MKIKKFFSKNKNMNSISSEEIEKWNEKVDKKTAEAEYKDRLIEFQEEYDKVVKEWGKNDDYARDLYNNIQYLLSHKDECIKEFIREEQEARRQARI